MTFEVILQFRKIMSLYNDSIHKKFYQHPFINGCARNPAVPESRKPLVFVVRCIRTYVPNNCYIQSAKILLLPPKYEIIMVHQSFIFPISLLILFASVLCFFFDDLSI